jgi:hypothetical protein
MKILLLSLLLISMAQVSFVSALRPKKVKTIVCVCGSMTNRVCSHCLSFVLPSKNLKNCTLRALFEMKLYLFARK